MSGGSANRFGVLGPLVVEIDGAERAPSAPRQRALLGLFLLHPGEPIPAERILDRLWGEDPPSGGVKTVGFHLSKLRDALEPDRERGTDGTVVRTTPAGYVLDVSTENVDASLFETLLQQARAVLQEDPGKAAALARDALGLWRGPALADFAYEEFAQDEIRRLEELRLRAMETRVEADLALGRHADLIAELERLIADHPLREGLRASLMLALYRSGRQADALRAYEDTRRILADEMGIDPSRELRDLEGRILAQDDSLDLPIWATPTAAAPRTDDTPNPFKGLRPFGEDDAEDFHGREDLVARVVAQLERSRFVALVGPSGCGKSSIASAGVIPVMRAGHRVARMLPGDRPLDQLEIGLLEPDRPLLLVIDQFEELWTLSSPDERAALIDRLIDAIADARTLLTVLVTVRSDFLGPPLSHPALGPLIEDGTVLIPPMSAADLEKAVVQPAGRVGIQVDPTLVASVVTDVAENPGALPLLQYALTEAFDRRDADSLTRADYERVGGLRGALAQRADQTFSSLAAPERETAQQVFLRLVTPGEGTTDTRRRATLTDLDHLGPDVEAIIDAFGRARLLTFDRDALTGEPTADIAHEAMLTEWDRLRSWIEDARDELTTRRRLDDLASEWDESGRDAGLLLAGGRLDRYAQFVETTTLLLTQTEREYVLAGHEAEASRQRRARTRRWALTGVLAAIASVAIVFAFVAAANGQRAERQARASGARALAIDAVEVLSNDPDLSLLLALEAARMDPSGDAMGALQQAVDSEGLV
ncbi:MAG TPA: BTAD domain-containing putative transcriptional regulator, partial [Acidimicrobiia bacterium]|nr:BTAD domain-containing putative transcriptional regulator [Acidimicrobiia bacterium]